MDTVMDTVIYTAIDTVIDTVIRLIATVNRSGPRCSALPMRRQSHPAASRRRRPCSIRAYACGYGQRMSSEARTGSQPLLLALRCVYWALHQLIRITTCAVF